MDRRAASNRPDFRMTTHCNRLDSELFGPLDDCTTSPIGQHLVGDHQRVRTWFQQPESFSLSSDAMAPVAQFPDHPAKRPANKIMIVNDEHPDHSTVNANGWRRLRAPTTDRELPRAGSTDYVVNDAALSYMRERALAEPVIAPRSTRGQAVCRSTSVPLSSLCVR